MGVCGGKGAKNKDNAKKDQDQKQQDTHPKSIENGQKNDKKAFTSQKTQFKVNPSIFVTLKKGDILNYYRIDQTLGEGSYGKVSLVTQKVTGLPRAMKQIKKEKIEQRDNMIQEVSILKELDHPNIVSVYELYEDEQYVYIITEYLSGGELFEKINEIDHFDETIAAGYMRKILEAVNYCHNKNVVHRDLKPENIIFESRKTNSSVKIIDFGTAKELLDSTKLSQRIGTPYYIAPEVISKQYDKKCDVWSCGVILFIMLCGYPPFNGQSQQELYQRIQAGVYSFDEPEWKEISGEAKDLIKKMLVTDPEKRISAQDALQHEWIKMTQKEKKINHKSLENLARFHSQSKLKVAIMQLITTQVMTNQEKKKLQKQFKKIDVNHDGTLSREELLQCYREIYNDELKCQQIVDHLFEQADVNGSNQIDYTEFVIAFAKKEQIMAQNKLEKAFKLFDKDGNGQISKQELQDIMGGVQLSDNQWSSVFGELDLNGDGVVTLQEFTEMLIKGANEQE
ncbi:unnamed protein product (macronuclear) [Paramecium tetraurelia]|uniref:Calcium-dependent protein kinase 1 n=1 Tax=Paramecium tetraurelia TaxID=5888 RepID=A0DPE0_PARTE|nr:uncharacterized protein GSPATT00019089001 [Paramecium tetraurelia]CAK84907.1 unnamed protein product [Paramecium tetraurelia]|eukprot:XP_001452304.1 hypothetical protein (macronuclear) [Paramecium tetraurelia strain d4-2]